MIKKNETCKSEIKSSYYSVKVGSCHNLIFFLRNRLQDSGNSTDTYVYIIYTDGIEVLKKISSWSLTFILGFGIFSYL